MAFLTHPHHKQAPPIDSESETCVHSPKDLVLRRPSVRIEIFNGGVCPVRWQSVSEIVRAFVEKDRPNHALIALGLILLTMVVLVLVPIAFLR